VDGWALSASGENEKGLAQIRAGLDGFGLGASQHVLLALQADAQLTIGKPEAALESVAAGLKAVEKMGGAPLEAELYRLRGEALLAGAGAVSEAEAAIEKGIDVARRQNAKSWELRGATSLARLLRQQGRPQEAVALLAPILGWFTEGLDTADLKEAKTLLDKLTEPGDCRRGVSPVRMAAFWPTRSPTGEVVKVGFGWCAVTRRRFPVGASPTRQPLQPEATGGRHRGDEMSEAFG